MLLLLLAAVALRGGTPAQAQGTVVLLNGRPELVLRDPATDECFVPQGREWRWEVRGAPKGTPREQWTVLRPPSHMGNGPLPSRAPMLAVPGGKPGAEAEIEIAVIHNGYPHVPVRFGPFTVQINAPERLEPTLTGSFTNDLPPALASVAPKWPSIPGEPKFEGKPLSYWLRAMSDSAPPPGAPFDRGRAGRPSRREAERAVLSLGLAATPYILEYPETNYFMRSVARNATATLSFSGQSNQVDLLLTQALFNTNQIVVENAMSALPCYLVKAQRPRLLELASGDLETVRHEALVRFIMCGATDTNLLPVFVAQLNARDVNQTSLALSGLSALGPAAASAAPKIEPLLQHGHPHVRLQAGVTLWKIDGRTNVITMLINEIRSANHFPTIMEVLASMQALGVPAKPVVPVLLEKLSNWTGQPPDLSPIIHRHAEDVLRMIDPGSEKKLPPLRDGLRMNPGPVPRVPEPAMPLG